jgi:hypothetical protein
MSAVRKIDGRTRQARKVRDLTLAFIRDLGGVDQLTAIELEKVKLAARVTIETERLHEIGDADARVRLGNIALRALDGLSGSRGRRPPSGQADLEDYLAEVA